MEYSTLHIVPQLDRPKLTTFNGFEEKTLHYKVKYYVFVIMVHFSGPPECMRT